MIRIPRSLVCCLLLLALGPTAVLAQAWAGKGRAEGRVVDANGKPVAGATVTLRQASAPDEGPEPLLTNDKGRWSYLGLGGGLWSVLIEKEGYLVSQGSISVNEFSPGPAIRIVLERSPTASITKGDALLEQGDFAAARAEYAKAFEALDPATQARLRTRIGETYILEGDYAAARAEYQQALAAVEPAEQAHILLQIGNSYQLEKKYSEARREYEKALLLLPPDDQASVLTTVAQGYGMENNTAAAIETLQRADETSPGNVQVLQLLIDLLMREGRNQEAEAYLARLPQDAELPSDMVLNMGIRVYNEGKMEEALGYFERAAAEHPDDPETYYYRGLVYLSMGRNDEAKGDFHRLLELAPDSPHKGEVEEFLKFLEPGS